MLTIHTLTYNEELMIEFFVNHYRKLFPNCIIKIYDNYSTDNTVNIAKNLGCEIFYYDSNNNLSDSKFLEIKNNCWKNSNTDWVIVCDCDELIQINQEELINEDNNGTTLFKFKGYHIMNTDDELNLNNLSFGFPDTMYDKILLFNKSKITDINYEPGCHSAFPKGDIIYSKNTYSLLHYKYLGVKYTIDRYKMFSQRLSEENLNRGWSIHYLTKENEIVKYYEKNKTSLIKVKN
jgi:hypothetical protein